MEEYFPSPRWGTEGLVNGDGEPIPRLFDPTVSSIHEMITESRLLVHDQQQGVRHMRRIFPRTNSIGTDPATMVIHTDGACRGNGNGARRPRASWGVFVADGSQWNDCGRLDRALPQTSASAKIEALWQALTIVGDILFYEPGITRVRIATDSLDLVTALAFCIWDWIDNDGYTDSGHPVAHFDRLVDIHNELDDLECEYGVSIKLWYVPRNRNTDADALANQALDS
ncbi:ribonuclease H-like protein [Hypoxylon rubiginosum]|uniref:Ribonuclease H-like protein n=1 Tax=Hypoxylon rubiginosum TaxID=110542 RepID=A0ACB9Z5N7_9PEZI|nr:ribonuclease H-like protein [Hypoxylon rubiginosum]